MIRFTPTHSFTLSARNDRQTVVRVEVRDGAAYERGRKDPTWRRGTDGQWIFVAWDRPDPSIVEVRRIVAGQDPRGPTKAEKRITINARPDQHAAYVAAAKRAGVPLSAWALGLLDAAVER